MALLEVQEVTKRFGGVIANHRISFTVHEGEILGLVGPNGAGKTTLFDVITGYTTPDSGVIRFRGKDITGLRPDRINRLGIARTFQKLRPFPTMTMVENVMVGALPRTASVRAAREEALRLLAFVGLAEQGETLAGAVGTGERKRLELARAMATKPSLLLLDEVTAGVDRKSIPALIDLIKRLRREGVTLIVIEHNMRVIMALSDRIVALHLGEKIADGPPQEVVQERGVIEAYLGETYAEGRGA